MSSQTEDLKEDDLPIIWRGFLRFVRLMASVEIYNLQDFHRRLASIKQFQKESRPPK